MVPGFPLISILYCIIRVQICFPAAQLLGSMDTNMEPCDDFFQFACGNWNKKNFIPEDRTSYNTFEKLIDDLQLTLRGNVNDIFQF